MATDKNDLQMKKDELMMTYSTGVSQRDSAEAILPRAEQARRNAFRLAKRLRCRGLLGLLPKKGQSLCWLVSGLHNSDESSRRLLRLCGNTGVTLTQYPSQVFTKQT